MTVDATPMEQRPEETRPAEPQAACVTVDTIRPCLEGAVPSMVATCAPDGTPNVTYASQVHYVDREHVALSFQFFSKTRENVLVNPVATVLVTDPTTAAQFWLSVRYLRTEECGPLFENMKAKLAGIASHTGMAGVFRLRGADVYRVLAIEHVPGPELMVVPPRCDPMSALRALTRIIGTQTDLAALLDAVLAGLHEHFGIEHAMILLSEARTRRLYTVASRGYEVSGVGSEIPFGQGVIGVAAEVNTAIRINHMTSEVSYSRAIRENTLRDGMADGIETEIPMPGVAEPHSQLAVPIVLAGRVAGVLYAESTEDMRFSYLEEDALLAVAAQLGLTIALLQQAAETPDVAPLSAALAPFIGKEAGGDAAKPRKTAKASTEPILVRHYRVNDSVFLGDEYLIKGVAGAIFTKLMRDYAEKKRTEFSNRELRLDSAIRLPDITDNLEARLILLQRRLAERCDYMRIVKTGRGRFRLDVARDVRLIEVAE